MGPTAEWSENRARHNNRHTLQEDIVVDDQWAKLSDFLFPLQLLRIKQSGNSLVEQVISLTLTRINKQKESVITVTVVLFCFTVFFGAKMC